MSSSISRPILKNTSQDHRIGQNVSLLTRTWLDKKSMIRTSKKIKHMYVHYGKLYVYVQH